MIVQVDGIHLYFEGHSWFLIQLLVGCFKVIMQSAPCSETLLWHLFLGLFFCVMWSKLDVWTRYCPSDLSRWFIHLPISGVAAIEKWMLSYYCGKIHLKLMKTWSNGRIFPLYSSTYGTWWNQWREMLCAMSGNLNPLESELKIEATLANYSNFCNILVPLKM